MAKNEIAQPEDNAAEVFGYAPPGASFDELADEAITLPGHELADDATLDALIGVDFIVTRVNFREGLARRDDNVWLKANPEMTKGAYVSLEITTNPSVDLAKINRARAACGKPVLPLISALGFTPGDTFVINDGSTGIYRQIVAFLSITNYITLPEGEMEGKSGQTVYDTVPEEWEDIHVGDVKFTADGFQTYAANVRLRCKRGIRVSEYPSEFNPDSKTRYLA